MKKIILILLLFFGFTNQAQELFVITEPASNMPTGSIGVRMSQYLLKRESFSGSNYFLMPEIMWGANKNLMIHASFFASNTTGNIQAEGGSLYAKYRFFSVDDIHSHFRMATFGRYSLNNSKVVYESISLNQNNSGYELGLVATQLFGKIAISSSFSYVRVLDNSFPTIQSNNAVNYTLSIGKLIYPKSYTNFKQTNINAMVEFAGQTLNENGKSYLDIVPSIQFIINSQARIDLGFKKQLISSISRFTTDGFLLKLEYTFFNVTN